MKVASATEGRDVELLLSYTQKWILWGTYYWTIIGQTLSSFVMGLNYEKEAN